MKVLILSSYLVKITLLANEAYEWYNKSIQMDIVKLQRHKSIVSDLAYIALNVALAIALLAVVLAVKSPLPAFLLVLLSKWRILAVRPRFWFKNLQSNLVDIIVGLSVVVLLYAAEGSLGVQIGITTFFAVWLLFIKPRSKRSYVAFQSGAAIFLGTTALFMESYEWPATIVVLMMWLIGYATARHVLSHYKEADRTFFSMIWGLIMAEIGWLGYHWAFAYSLPGLSGIELSQTALIALIVSFLADRVYDSYYRNEGTLQSSEIMLPTIFSVSVILVILLFFNTLGTGVL